MDADANLQQQLELADGIQAGLDRLEDLTLPKHMLEAIDRLTELVQALDSWMRNGGCAPQRWQTSGVVFGYLALCCHRVRWWYAIEDTEITHEYRDELRENARLDARKNIVLGTCSGELEYSHEPSAPKVHGGWAIV